MDEKGFRLRPACFDFVITDGQVTRLFYAQSESEALRAAKYDKVFRRGAGIWCEGISDAHRQEVFNPRNIFPPFLEPIYSDRPWAEPELDDFGR